MSSTLAKQPTSNDTRAELRRVAGTLDNARLHRNPSVGPAHFYLRVGDKTGQSDIAEVEVSPATLNQIARLIENAESDAARVRQRHDDLSTQKAANLLGVSRPYLVKLLDTEQIPYRLVGRYRRVRRADVEQFERESQQRRRAGLEELAAFTQEIGLEY